MPFPSKRGTQEKKYDELRREELIKLLTERDADETGGIRIAYPGQTPPWQIVRKVQPRRQRIDKKLSYGSEEQQTENLIVEGENLQAMVSLYKYRGQVDLIIADPPYNTGNDFRYNDRWDEDPNDPDLGNLVPADDGSRHTKWLRFMTPRLWMMKEMLKPGGVCCVCIDERELFRLGMLMDKTFDEANRIAIINWQKSYSAKNQSGHVSTATEYILVYSKSKEKAKTSLLERTESMNSKYKTVDGDIHAWRPDNLSAQAHNKPEDYGIQSPFTGEIHYPSGMGRWRRRKSDIKKHLEEWGSQYIEIKDPNCTFSSLVLKGTRVEDGKLVTPSDLIQKSRTQALFVLKNKIWPTIYFGLEGEGRPALKRYLKDVKKGRLTTTYWADEDYEDLTVLGAQSWEHTESGHSQTGVNELSALVGPKHNFETVKPLRLIKKLIQIWCPNSGIVLDPFAGSGTTGHAVLELNNESESNRRFILIEQGRPEKGDAYARTLTCERIKQAITGERVGKDGNPTFPAEPLEGGFRFTQLTKTVDAEGVLALEREEMLDLLLTSHWEQNERSGAYLKRLPTGSYAYLFAVNGKNEGFYLVWNGPNKSSLLNRDAFRGIVEESKTIELKPTYHVYARICTYSGPNIEFYQIPDRILDKLGFNATTQPYNTEEEEEGIS